MTGPKPLDYGWWLASRSAGVVALLAVSISVIIGLMMANNLPKRPGAKKQLLAIHESTALAGLVAIGVHGLTLLGDKWMHPTLSQIALPFTIDYRQGFTGLGIIGGWLALFLGLSFYVRKRIGNKRWRSIHRATIVVWALAVIHTLGAGTDGTQPWMLGILLLTGVPIVFLFLRRVLPADEPRRPSPLPDQSPAERLAAAERRAIARRLAAHRQHSETREVVR